MDQHQMGPACSCPHHKAAPFFIFLLGLLFLLYALNVFSWDFTAVAWPILVMLIGLTKMFKHKCGCCMRDK